MLKKKAYCFGFYYFFLSSGSVIWLGYSGDKKKHAFLFVCFFWLITITAEYNSGSQSILMFCLAVQYSVSHCEKMFSLLYIVCKIFINKSYAIFPHFQHLLLNLTEARLYYSIRQTVEFLLWHLWKDTKYTQKDTSLWIKIFTRLLYCVIYFGITKEAFWVTWSSSEMMTGFNSLGKSRSLKNWKL